MRTQWEKEEGRRGREEKGKGGKGRREGRTKKGSGRRERVEGRRERGMEREMERGLSSAPPG